MLLTDFFWRLEMKYAVLSFRPLVLFYIFGIILTPIGLLAGLYSLYYKFMLGGSLFIRRTLAFMLFIVGVQFLLFDMEVDRSECGSGGWG